MPSDPEFDVFLSHNSQDKPAVRRLADALEDRGIRAFLDSLIDFRRRTASKKQSR